MYAWEKYDIIMIQNVYQLIYLRIMSLDLALHNETERCELMQEISERVQVETTCIDQNPKVSLSV